MKFGIKNGLIFGIFTFVISGIAFAQENVVLPRIEGSATNLTVNHEQNKPNEQEVNEMFKPFMDNLTRSIKMNWDPPKGPESNKIQVLLTIAKDGRLLKSSLYKSSGSKAADDRALDAVRLASPFSPLPDKFEGKSIEMLFTFDYNVFSRENPIYPIVSPFSSDFNPNKMYVKFTDDTLIMKKDAFLYRDGYVYLKTQKSNSNFKHYKIDCVNNKIGSQTSQNAYARILYGDVHMHTPTGFDKKVFDYACVE